jgi:phosphopantetheinyl transferase
MYATHQQTSFQAGMVQECLRTMRRSLNIQQEILKSLVAKASTLRPRVPALRRNCDTMFSNFWQEPIEHFPASYGFRCCRIFNAEGQIRPKIPYHIIFSQRELKAWFHLPAQAKRRREWLLGRLAAKDAIRLLLKEQHGLELCPSTIEIAADEYGRPIVWGELVESLGCRLSISIAHSGGGAVAIAGDCDDHNGVGIDIERVGQSPDGLERITLSIKERALLSTVPPSKRDEWFLRLWCAKEAVAKAVGRGMLGGPLGLVVQNLEEDVGRVDVTLAGALARQLPLYAHTLLTAYTGREDAYVFASSLTN